MLSRIGFAVLALFFCNIQLVFSQKPTKLRHVRIRDQRNEYGRTIMYGSYVPMRGINSGAKLIGVYNIDSNKHYYFNIALGGKEGSFFRWYTPPGRYIILKHYWAQERFEGGLGHADDVFKWGRMANSSGLNRNPVDGIEERFTFYIAPDTVTYVGAWHFENLQVSFANEKIMQDSTELYKTVRKKLDITNSLINIPK